MLLDPLDTVGERGARHTLTATLTILVFGCAAAACRVHSLDCIFATLF